MYWRESEPYIDMRHVGSLGLTEIMREWTDRNNWESPSTDQTYRILNMSNKKNFFLYILKLMF